MWGCKWEEAITAITAKHEIRCFGGKGPQWKHMHKSKISISHKNQNSPTYSKSMLKINGKNHIFPP